MAITNIQFILILSYIQLESILFLLSLSLSLLSLPLSLSLSLHLTLYLPFSFFLSFFFLSNSLFCPSLTEVCQYCKYFMNQVEI